MGSVNLAGPADAGDTAPIDLVAQLGSEVAGTLSAALERVNALATTGRIDGLSLRALRDEIEMARRIGIMGQQVSRYASGRVRISSETLDIGALLEEALHQRAPEIEARGLEVRRHVQPAEVLVDAALCVSLLQALLDWAFEHARSPIDVSIDPSVGQIHARPAHARVGCSFAHAAGGDARAITPAVAPRLDTMAWRLLAQTAATLGLLLTRSERAGRTTAMIEFPRRAGEPMEGVSAIELDGPVESAEHQRSLVGNHVLVVAARREVRHLVRDALHATGMLVDFVTSVDDAREFCRGGLPHAVVHEAVLGGRSFEHLRTELLQAAPTLAFVQISEENHAFEVHRAAGREHVSVGRAFIAESLPAALVYELARDG
jgi:hypothetical protein